MRSRQLRGSLFLVLGAAIWGCAFVAQTVGMDNLGAITFHCVRSLLAGFTMLAVILVRNRGKINLRKKSSTLKAGILCGIPLCTASLLQQFSLVYTTVSKSSFITAMYVLFVPIFCLFLRKRPSWRIWPCVAIALAGLYLLSMQESMSLSRGDSLAMLCAMFFAVQIMFVDHFVGSEVDPIELNCVQFFTSGLLTLPFMIFLEMPAPAAILSAWLPIGYAGILSGGMGYALQNIGQKDVKPSIASLLMSLESVFGALSGWLLIGQRMSLREIGGCALMFIAIVLAQIPSAQKK